MTASNNQMLSRAGAVAVEEHEQIAQIVGFALRWYRHGGGSDSAIRERFGLEPTRYFTNLLWELTTDPPTPIRPSVVDSVTSVARRRLWLASLDVPE